MKLHPSTVIVGSTLAVLLSSSNPVTHSSQQSAGAHARATRTYLPAPGEFNVLVIVLDDLGTDQLAMYGNDVGPPGVCTSAQFNSTPTPWLDDMRANGVMFARTYVNPTCSPSRACLMTGRYGRRTGVGHHINPTDPPGSGLSSAETFLPEMLRDLHATSTLYARGAFGKWHLTDYSSSTDCHPADNGFETFQGHKGNNDSHFDWERVTATGGTTSGCTGTTTESIAASPSSPPSEENWDASITRRDAVAWINADSRPFLAYVAFNPPHGPYETPPYTDLSARSQARLSYLEYNPGDPPRSDEAGHDQIVYHASVEALDTEIHKLLTGIGSRLTNTIVIVIGDNGTPGDIIEDPLLSGHGKRTLYELGTRVPMIVYGPLASWNPNSTCREFVEGVDIWRTVANLTGIRDADIDAAYPSTTIDSRSFMTLVQHPAAAGARTHGYSEAFKNTTSPPPPDAGYRRGITDGEYHYIRAFSDAGVLTEELYHSLVDLCESDDLLLAPHVLTPPESAALLALQTAMDAI